MVIICGCELAADISVLSQRFWLSKRTKSGIISVDISTKDVWYWSGQVCNLWCKSTCSVRAQHV